MADKLATNTFDKGLNLDLNPLVAPNNVLSDCLNGTFLTFNGQDYTLQNDMGNAAINYTTEQNEIKNVSLKEGFIPVGMTSFGGVLYIISHNPLKNISEVGSFPSTLINYDNSEFSKNIDYQKLFQNKSLVYTLKKETDETLVAGPYDYIMLNYEGTLLEELINQNYATINVFYGGTEANIDNNTYSNETNAYNEISIVIKLSEENIHYPKLQWDYAQHRIFISAFYEESDNDLISYEVYDPRVIGGYITSDPILYKAENTYLKYTREWFYTEELHENFFQQRVWLNAKCKVKINFKGETFEYENIYLYPITSTPESYGLLINDKLEFNLTANNILITTNFKYSTTFEDLSGLIWEGRQIIKSKDGTIKIGEIITIDDKFHSTIHRLNGSFDLKDVVAISRNMGNYGQYLRSIHFTGIYDKYYTDKEFDFACIPNQVIYNTQFNYAQSLKYNALDIANKTSNKIDLEYQYYIKTSCNIEDVPYELDDVNDTVTQSIQIYGVETTFTEKQGDILVMSNDHAKEELINTNNTFHLGVGSRCVEAGVSNRKLGGVFSLPLEKNEYDNYVNRYSDSENLITANPTSNGWYKEVTAHPYSTSTNNNDTDVLLFYKRNTDDDVEEKLVTYNTNFKQFIIDKMADYQFGWLGTPFNTINNSTNKFMATPYIGLYIAEKTPIVGTGIGTGTHDSWSFTDGGGYFLFWTGIGNGGFKGKDYIKYNKIDGEDISWSYQRINGQTNYPEDTLKAKLPLIEGYIIYKISDNDFILLGAGDPSDISLDYIPHEILFENRDERVKYMDYLSFVQEKINNYLSKYYCADLQKNINYNVLNLSNIITPEQISDYHIFLPNSFKYAMSIKNILDPNDLEDDVYDRLFVHKLVNTQTVLPIKYKKIEESTLLENINSELNTYYQNIDNQIQPVLFKNGILKITDKENNLLNQEVIYKIENGEYVPINNEDPVQLSIINDKIVIVPKSSQYCYMAKGMVEIKPTGSKGANEPRNQLNISLDDMPVVYKHE